MKGKLFGFLSRMLCLLVLPGLLTVHVSAVFITDTEPLINTFLPTQGTKPPTGDAARLGLWLAVMLVSALLLLCLFLLLRRKNAKSKH